MAHADTVLLDLEDPAGSTGTPISLPFVANSTLTKITFEGYQVPATLSVNDISLALTGGGPELLGMTWAFTPAPHGSGALQGPVGAFGVNDLRFFGVVEDSFDLFSQTAPTIVGDSYTLSFTFANSPANQPSELIVMASSATPASTPVPSTAVMSCILLGMFGAVWSFRSFRWPKRTPAVH